MTIHRVALTLALLVPTAAHAQNDLREFRIGMTVADLPQSGYGGFTCAGEPSKTLPGWQAYQSCPAAPDGTHAVSFRYDDAGAGNEDGGKTIVGGQPVHLALLLTNDGKLDGIKIDTDPNARLYMHKKAFLFGLQARARFGPDGWKCSQLPSTQAEQPVGGVFIHEHCEKETDSRRFVVDRQLFRDPSKDLRAFTDATQVLIRGAG